jgi:hypothetical protein
MTTLAIALVILILAAPVQSWTSGAGNRNVQAGACSAHDVQSSATITMSTSNASPLPGAQLTVSVSVSGGTSSGLMGVALLSKISGSSGTLPTENGWTIVSDPGGTTYNYDEQSYTGSKTFTWTLKAPETAGSYKLYSMIYHGSSLYVKTYTNGLTITVQAAQVPAPTVSITAPAIGSTISGTATVNANAVPASGATISSCELRVDGGLVGTDTTSPYSWSLNTASYSNGQHTLNVTAIDNGGRKGFSQIVVTFNNIPPTVSFASPASGAVVSGTISISVASTAYGGRTVASMQLRIDSLTIGALTKSPYTWNVDTNGLGNGAHTLNVTSTDSLGYVGYAQSSIVISNPPPVVSIVSPTNGAQVKGSVAITVSATSNSTISYVALYFDSNSLGNRTALPYTFTLNTLSYGDGQHTIRAVAGDGYGRIGEIQITITVNNTGEAVAVPIISISVPTNGATLSGTNTIAANVTSSKSISSVSVQLDEVVILTKASSPFSWSLNTGNYADGQHTLNVSAIDSSGKIGYQQIMVFFSNTGPSVGITSIVQGQMLLGNVWVNATATSSSMITNLDVLVDGAVVYSTMASPLAWQLDTNALVDGDHIINVTATDASGKKGTATLDIIIMNQAPSFTVEGIDGILAGRVNVTVSLANSAIAESANFIVDGMELGTAFSVPYTFQIDTVTFTDGNHTLDVSVKGINGKFANQSLMITISNPAPQVSVVGVPSDGATVSGVIDLLANVTAPYPLLYVNLTVNGQESGNTTIAPYVMTLDTTNLANGEHTINVTAMGAGGKSTTTSFALRVFNAPPPLQIELSSVDLLVLYTLIIISALGIALSRKKK